LPPGENVIFMQYYYLEQLCPTRGPRAECENRMRAAQFRFSL